jgi:dihydrodipicolinate synthase/N-acetylneuraminate lyase
MSKNIEGVIPVLFTPFDQNEKIEYSALDNLIEFLIDKGVDGFFPCGSVSLGPLMKPEERKKVLEFTVKINHHRVPIIAQVGAADTQSTVNLAQHAQSLGVDAIASIPPFYIPSDEEAMYMHFKAIKDAVNIPVYAYNNLWTGNLISVRLFEKLIDLGYQGMKDAGEDFQLHCNFLRVSPPGFNLLMGTEKMALPALNMGVKGFTSGTVNAFPELNVALYRSFQQGNTKKSIEIQNKILKLIDILSQGHQISMMYSCLKFRGIDIGKPRRPLLPVSQQLEEKVKNEIEELGLLNKPYF